MKVTAKTSFIHGSVTFKRGDTAEVSNTTGDALIKAGLVQEAKAVDKPTGGGKQEVKVPVKTATKLAAKPALETKA